MLAVRILVLTILVLLRPILSAAQVNDHFSDGNFSANPTWKGSENSWSVNSTGQLQSNNKTAGASFYICTESKLATLAEWQFSVQLKFNTSSTNYVDAYIMASSDSLNLPSTTGYFVRIGGTDDEVSLFQKNKDGKSIKLIDGVNGSTNSSDNNLTIKITRTQDGLFTLWRTEKSTGQFLQEGSVTNNVYLTSGFFGFFIKQSTASFFGKHYFDDVQVQPVYTDTIAPTLLGATVTSSHSVDVLFSEEVTPASAQQAAHYFVNSGVGAAAAAVPDAVNKALVHVSFTKPFPNSDSLLLTAAYLQDVAGNTSPSQTFLFSFYTPQRFDVIIDEIMADPSPPQGLPNTEYIELKNTSSKAINLEGWQLSTFTANSHPFSKFILKPDSFCIIASTSAAAQLSVYGPTLGIANFPTLLNDSSTLQLFSKEGVMIHSVHYNTNEYKNVVKEEGGWSLEMIDPHFPCTGVANWRWSTDANGGTPGKMNSVNGNNIDKTAPEILNVSILDSSTLLLQFNEPLDSIKAANAAAFTLWPAVKVKNVMVTPPLYQSVLIKLQAPLSAHLIYTLTINSVTDCAGNAFINTSPLRFGLPKMATNKDVVINEILFNPKPINADYVELYNRSNKIIDVAQLYIANRNSSGVISSVKKLFQNPLYIFPGDYLVLTEDVDGLQKGYLVKNKAAVIKLSSMPSLPDTGGDVLILNAAGDIIDEVEYKQEWHFQLIQNTEGVALERIDPEEESSDKNNWQSAAATAGYGTPTYKNSQYKRVDISKAGVEITPKVFSPDGDGFDDVATIVYNMAQTGFMANILVFDANGKVVRHLVKNELLSLKGSWKWDGLDEKGNKLAVGNYIIYTEIYNLTGKKEAFKNTVVLARRIN